jgi:hypothetical protein
MVADPFGDELVTNMEEEFVCDIVAARILDVTSSVSGFARTSPSNTIENNNHRIEFFGSYLKFVIKK